MNNIGPWEAIGYGFAGGLAAAFYEIYNLRYIPENRRPAWLKSKFYWTMIVGRVLLGGFIVLLYVRNGEILHVFQCFYLGGSAPFVLSGLIGGKRRMEPGRTDLDTPRKTLKRSAAASRS